MITRASFALAAAAATLASCGGAPAMQPHAVDLAQAEARTELSLPADPAFVASFTVAILDTPAVRARVHFDAFAKELALAPDPATGMFDTLGIDAARPIAFAIARPSAEAQAAVDALRATFAKGPSAGPSLVDDVRRAVRAIPTTFAARLLLPAKDSAKMKRAIAAFLAASRFKKESETDFSHDDGYVSIADDGKTVAIDFVRGASPRDALTSFRASIAKAHRAAPAVLHASYVPAAIAALAYVATQQTTLAATSSESVDASQRMRIVAEGLADGEHDLDVAENAKGASFDRVDITAPATEITLRAEPGPGFSALPEALWKHHASPVFHGTIAGIDVAPRTLDAWPALEGKEGPSLARTLVGMVRNFGSASFFIALPQSPLLAREIVTSERPAWMSDETYSRFDRVGYAVMPDQSSFQWGLLPEKTTRAAAECVLANQAPCSTETRLPLGVATKRKTTGVWSEELVEAGGRFAVIASEDRMPSDVKMTFAEKAPFTFYVPLHTLVAATAPDLASLVPESVEGSIDREGTAIVTHLALHASAAAR